MWDLVREALKGKKTNLISAWAFCGALYMWMNGIGEAEQQAILATVAALAASMRAGMARNMPVFLVGGIVASVMFLGGCATLGIIDPATGTSPAQDLVTAITPIAGLFGPIIGTAVPLGLASLLSIIITLGKVKDATPTTGTTS